MMQPSLPQAAQDILRIPGDKVPGVIQGLIRHRRLSAVVTRIHGELASTDPALREKARSALRHMGFVE